MRQTDYDHTLCAELQKHPLMLILSNSLFGLAPWRRVVNNQRLRRRRMTCHSPSVSLDAMLTWLQRDTLTFPLAKAMREPNGLLAAGGDLSAERLIQAYRHGCFPGSPKASLSSGGHPTRAR